MKAPIFGYDDQTLREVVSDPQELKNYISSLEDHLKQTTDPKQQVSLLGEMGTYLRSSGQLQQAEEKLKSALQLIETYTLGSRSRAQQQIRLAHVYQWKKDFDKSNSLFDEVISLCRNDQGASIYLDFALQHAGKNFFDQQKFEKALACFEEALRIRIEKGSSGDQMDSTRKAIAETRRRISKA